MGMFIFYLLIAIFLIIVLSLIFGFNTGSSIYILILIIFEFYIYFLINLQKKSINLEQIRNKLDLDDEELKIFLKYPTFFLYTIASKDFSAFFSLIQLSSFIFGPIFLFSKMYFKLIFVIINYFIASDIAFKLNPQHFLHHAVEKQNIKNINLKLELEREMKLVDNILKKLGNFYLNKNKYLK